jgi:hypothetical protein
MTSDATTFFLAFTAIFGGLAWFLWHIERHMDRLERQLAERSARVDSGRDGSPGDNPEARR